MKTNTVILHSRADEVVPFSDSEELVRNSGLPSGSLIEVGWEHRLADPESLAKMLEVVERANVAPELVDVTVYYLEMLAHQRRSVPAPREGVTILQVRTPSVPYYRFLYNAVGKDYHWLSRRKLSDTELAAIIQDPRNELYVQHAGEWLMDQKMTAKKTISEVFKEFLSDQEARLSPTTFSKYESIISLFRSYLEAYWPDHGQKEYSRITDQGGTFCGTFGPEEIPGGYSEFLGYFMPRKVACGKDTLKAAGTVTKKLAKWLAEKGYVKDTEAAQERAKEAARDLPAAQDLLDLLEEYVAINAPDNYEDEIQDHFSIKKIEPGRLWLKPFTMFDKVIGPVPVPAEVTQVCGEMWDISGVVVKTRRGWRFLEVWNVTP